MQPALLCCGAGNIHTKTLLFEDQLVRATIATNMSVNNAAIEGHVLNVIFALVAFYVLLKYFVEL
jgi:hypothetical protein